LRNYYSDEKIVRGQEAIEAKLEELTISGIKPGLLGINELLRCLGYPHKDLSVIHVAGTNGKGSVCAMLESCLREAGFHVGLYTSPHLARYNERIRVDDELISDEQLLGLFDEIKAILPELQASIGKKPTFFEVLTAAAFLWFKRQDTDIVVLETGMGGRFDSTNVFNDPLVTIITSISMDHERYFGSSILRIGFEKAGIIKKGAPLVTSCDNREALEVIKGEFEAIQGDAARTPLIDIWETCRWETKGLGAKGQEVSVRSETRSYDKLYLPLSGRYQCANLACVITAWERLRTRLPEGAADRLTDTALRQGLARVAWPCRLESVQERPTVVLDGSHNPDGIRQSAIWLAGERERYDKVILVMGRVDDKDRLSAAAELDGMVSKVIITKPLSSRAGHWDELAKGFKLIGKDNVLFIEDCHEAINTAIEMASENDMVFCTGSLSLIGQVRKNWEGLFERE
jgi:dihydrofolate synthase/folylpolyglutamate synthase